MRKKRVLISARFIRAILEPFRSELLVCRFLQRRFLHGAPARVLLRDERLDPLREQTVRIRIVDHATGPWGHINVGGIAIER